MFRTNLPRAIRYLRVRRRWRQEDVASRARTSRQLVSRLERGLVDNVPLGVVVRVAGALDASVDLTLRWRGEQLDRLMDAPHAAVQEHTARLLSACGWSVKPEVSFNHYGERGRIDILAFHPAAASLLVVEVKSGIGDVQDLLGRLDVKNRVGRTVAREVGWVDVGSVLPAIVVAEGTTARRVLQRHATLFSRFDRRGREATAWLRTPAPPMPRGLLWLVRLPDAHPVSVTRVVRVRRPARRV